MYSLTDEQKRALDIKMKTCPCCKETVKNISEIKRMFGIGDMKTLYACSSCAEGYFESVKEKYFVEEYKDNRFYKYKDYFYPYWEAGYYYETIEGCRSRTDNTTVAVMAISL